MDATTPHILASHVSDGSGQSAAALWKQLPAIYIKGARAISYGSRRSLCRDNSPCATPRHLEAGAQDPSCRALQLYVTATGLAVGRATLSFSKKLSDHSGASRYFICDYHRMRRAAVLEQYSPADDELIAPITAHRVLLMNAVGGERLIMGRREGRESADRWSQLHR